jgi:lipopolysaccharide/colanic/teichoic acid biosynthesis glycosyltransferase
MSLIEYDFPAKAQCGTAIGVDHAAIGAFSHPRHREGACRFLNVTVAALGLILAAPLMALIALAVKLTSPGPVFYRQTRVGLLSPDGGNAGSNDEPWGRLFTSYTFRTMHIVASAKEKRVRRGTAGPRITTIGHVLRRSRLDELPQLLNVLTGDMNIVGPRPQLPRIFASLREQVPGYALRQRVRPGITGLAQITLGNDTSIDAARRMVALDLQYIATRSLLTDLGIMLRTVPVMVMRIGSRTHPAAPNRGPLESAY